MPGILEQQPQQMQQPQQSQQQNPQAQSGDVEQRQRSLISAVQRVVLAAQKIMYGQKTHAFFMRQLQGFKDPRQQAAMGAIALIAMIKQQAQNALDPRTIVPAGIVLVADILDFLGKTSNQEFSEDDNTQAISMFLQAITKLMGGAQQQPQQQQQQQETPDQGGQTQEVMQ